MVWNYNPQRCASAAFLLMKLSNVLEVLSSSANFVVYCICRQQFRAILRSRLQGHCATPAIQRYDVITLAQRPPTATEC